MDAMHSRDWKICTWLDIDLICLFINVKNKFTLMHVSMSEWKLEMENKQLKRRMVCAYCISTQLKKAHNTHRKGRELLTTACILAMLHTGWFVVKSSLNVWCWWPEYYENGQSIVDVHQWNFGWKMLFFNKKIWYLQNSEIHLRNYVRWHLYKRSKLFPKIHFINVQWFI